MKFRLIGAGILAAAATLLPRHAPAAEPGTAHPGPAIWRVRTSQSTVYLFGSMHILPPGYSWTTKRIRDAMSASDRFVFEVPVGKDALAEEREFIVKNGVLPRRQSIRALLSASQFDVYDSVMRHAGLNPAAYERYRPWLAALVLGLAYLHPDNLVALKGADDEVMDYAQQHQREVAYLETPLQQLQLLTTGSEQSQLASLRNMIESLPSSRSIERDLRDAWIQGDADGLNTLLDRIFARSRVAQDFLVGRRNRLWLPAIDAALRQPGSTMVTVGAAHIGGRGGLIALLCNEGFKVERLSEDGREIGACSGSGAVTETPGQS